MENALFWVSKLFWFFASPDNLLVVALLAGILFLLIGWVRIASVLVGGSMAAILLITILPVGEWLIYALESRYPQYEESGEPVDGILVMSGAIDPVATRQWGQPVVGGAAERLIAFSVLARKYPEARLVFSGGSGRLTDQELKTADVAEQLLEEMGIPPGRIIFERQSRNSTESAQLSKKLVDPQKSENWLLVTSAFHMPRALGVFCKEDWVMTAYPVDFRSLPSRMYRPTWAFSKNLRGLVVGSREWLGYFYYKLLARSC